MPKNEFVTYVTDLLSEIAPITARAMFGGYGLYREGIIVGSVIENELYFKADKETAAYFKTYGSEPFVYSGSGKAVAMPYWTVPTDILENPELLTEWFARAWAVAVATAKKKKSPK